MYPEPEEHTLSNLCQIAGQHTERLLQRHISAHSEKNLSGASAPGERRYDHTRQRRGQKGIQNPGNHLSHADQKAFHSYLSAKQLGNIHKHIRDGIFSSGFVFPVLFRYFPHVCLILSYFSRKPFRTSGRFFRNGLLRYRTFTIRIKQESLSVGIPARND